MLPFERKGTNYKSRKMTDLVPLSLLEFTFRVSTGRTFCLTLRKQITVMVITCYHRD